MEWANRLRWVIDEGRLLLDYQDVRPLQGQPADDPSIVLPTRLRAAEVRVVSPGALLTEAERYGLIQASVHWQTGWAFYMKSCLHVRGYVPVTAFPNPAHRTTAPHRP